MKLNVSISAVLVVVAVAIVATAYRVSTAPDRIRKRLDSAKSTCLSTGGNWIKVDNVEACEPAAERKKS